jgi:hypothetical protein
MQDAREASRLVTCAEAARAAGDPPGADSVYILGSIVESAGGLQEASGRRVVGSGRRIYTRDRISAAALVVSAVTFVAVIVTPVPSAPAKGAGFSSERMLLGAAAERRAVLEDHDALGDLHRRVEPLLKMAAAEASPKSDVSETIRAEVERELATRWKVFERRLRTIRK